MARRFGEIALDLNLVGREELELGLDYQENLRRKSGSAPPIGAVLVKLGFLSREQVVEILRVAESELTPNDRLFTKIASRSVSTPLRTFASAVELTVMTAAISRRSSKCSKRIDDIFRPPRRSGERPL